jgi:hypothetical protein
MASICCSPPEREDGEDLVERRPFVGGGASRAPGRDLQVLQHRQIGEDAPPLGDVDDSGPDPLRGRQAGDVLAVEADLDLGPHEDAGDRPEQRRLARAVGAEDGDDLALADLDCDGVEDFDRAVAAPGDPGFEAGRHRAPASASASAVVRPR